MKNNVIEFAPLQSMILFAIPFALVTWIMCMENADLTMNKELFVGFFYPVYLTCLMILNKRRYAPLLLNIIIFPISGLAYLAGGILMLLFNAVTFELLIPIGMYYCKFNNKKMWYLGLGCTTVTIIIAVMCIAACNIEVMNSFRGFLDPSKADYYKYVLHEIQNAKWFVFNPGSDLIRKVNSDSAVTYTHIMAIFGETVTYAIILMQASRVVLMFIRSLNFTEMKNKLLGLSASIIIGVQLIGAVSSSFIRCPLCECGAPFITYKGLEYCLIPLVWFCMIIINDGKEKIKKTQNRFLLWLSNVFLATDGDK